MADIKQAGIWLSEGKKVTNPYLYFGYLFLDCNGFIMFHTNVEVEDVYPDMLEPSDLTSEEWYIYES